MFPVKLKPGDLVASMLPMLTNGTVVRPSGSNGALWCVPADTVTKLLQTRPITTMKLSIRQLSIVSKANLQWLKNWAQNSELLRIPKLSNLFGKTKTIQTCRT